MTILVTTVDPVIRVTPLVVRILDDAQARGLDVRRLRSWLRAPFSQHEHVKARIATLSTRPRRAEDEAELRLARLIAALSARPAAGGFAALHARAWEAVRALEQPEARAA